MQYGQRLKKIRKAKKISVYKLAQESGISQGHISDLENGRNQPTIDTLKRILLPLGVTLSDFFLEDGEVSVLNDREKELVTNFRTLPDDKAELCFMLIKSLNQ